MNKTLSTFFRSAGETGNASAPMLQVVLVCMPE